MDERQEFDRAMTDLKSALYEAFRPIAEWFIEREWAIAVIGGVAIGLVIGLTALGWYEVR